MSIYAVATEEETLDGREGDEGSEDQTGKTKTKIEMEPESLAQGDGGRVRSKNDC